MTASPITIAKRRIGVHKAFLEARFEDPTVLASDFWMYVELWLKRRHSSKAIFYWTQANEFYKASQGLSSVASPLTLYYCFLNAIKALLEQKNITSPPQHGLSGKSVTKKATLSGEQIRFARRGIAAALSQFLGDQDQRDTYSLKQLLYNLAFVHRPYTLTFHKMAELFVPLRSAIYVRKEGSDEAWVQIETEEWFLSGETLSALPFGYERDIGIRDKVIFRRRRRFKWEDGEVALERNLRRIAAYNQSTRRHIVYIRGQPPTWYLKLSPIRSDLVQRSSLTLMLAAMHRLSELARYEPLRLQLLLETQQNWLISEFIGSAPLQFLDEIATEITGQNLATPFVRGLR
jgi:hypothetical protein